MEKKKVKKNSTSSLREKKIIKTQSEIEKELNIRSYSEYKIKDEDSMFDYDDEDIESKMIRLVILKKQGGNVLDNINIPKKKISKKEFSSKILKIEKALSILENIFYKKKKKKLLKKLKKKTSSVHFKKYDMLFFQKLKRCIWGICIRRYYDHLMKYLINYREILNKNKSVSILTLSPELNRKKSKRIKMHNNKNFKPELKIKKTNTQRKSGVDFILEKIEKEKEALKQQTNISNNILDKKIKKLNTLNQKEKEYLKKIKQMKKKLINEINIFKMKSCAIEEGTISQTEKASSFFSGKSPSEIYSVKLNENNINDTLMEVLSNNDNISSINEIIQLKDCKKDDNNNNNDNDNELYSLNSKASEKTPEPKKELGKNLMRKSLKILNKKSISRVGSKKNMRSSCKLSELKTKSKKKEKEYISIFDLKKNQEKTEIKKESSSNISEFLDKIEKEEDKDKEEEKDKNNEKEKEEEEEEEDDEEEEEEEDDTDYFINLPDEEEKAELIKKTNLVEYDKFYKEQFLKNEVFQYDVENIKDKEVEKINKEIKKYDIKRKLNEKKRLKDVLESKGLDTEELQEEINNLNEKYNETKKIEKQKIDLNMNLTEDFNNKGRILNIYFLQKKGTNIIPRFAVESPEDIGAKEIIGFKPLREEELIRRYFDYCFCLEERKRINKFLVYSRYICKFFVDNYIFENLSLIIITINSILIFISDPTIRNNIGNRTDFYFLMFYALEAVLKIITFTFYSAEDAYIKDYWNILDFIVVIIGFISFIIEKEMIDSKISGLSALKAFRILRPLKTLKKLTYLKKLVIELLASISNLGQTMIILFFFFLIFAIAGLQMWQGLFYRRCMNVNFGYFYSVKNDDYMCSFDSNCNSLNTYGQTFICAKGYINPNNGALNFDNIGTALVTVFVMVTLEGWSYIFTYVSKTFKDKIYINQIIIFLYFHSFVYIGSFFLINLFLAVINSKFEKINSSKKMLNDKKSFIKLIKEKYDPKEKEKLEKKEKEKKLKNQNRTNDEMLDKIKKEAFHIKKNKMIIPKLYSTVKDIYIMANNNPEELYLEKLRIRDEEKSLCLDIERQLQEIELLMNEKRIEINKAKINKKNSKSKIKKKDEKKEENKEESKINEKYKNSENNILINNNKSDNLEESKNNTDKINNNINQNEISADMSNIIKLKNNINIKLIEISIDNTEKYFNDQIISEKKKFKKRMKERNKVKIADKNENKNEKDNQVTFFEDTSFEKDLSKLNKFKKKRSLRKHLTKRQLKAQDIISDQSFSFLNKHHKDRSSIKLFNLLQNRGSLEDNNKKQENSINKELSFIDELSLSSLNESSETMNNHRKLKYKNFGTNINTNNGNFFMSKIIMDDYKKNLDNFSNDDGLFKPNNIFNSNNKLRKRVNLKDSELKYINNLKDSFIIDNKNIINTKEVKINKDISLKSKFEKPYSLLNFMTKYEDEQKFDEENIKFNLENYLKKEFERNNDFLNKDKRQSFLGFMEYAQLQKESNQLEELIQKYSDEENCIDDNNGNYLHFLSEDSYLSRNNNISIEDNELLPKKIFDEKLYKNEYMIHENIKKNLDSNKLTQKIRSEIFDRQSINTNIYLKANELKKFYEETNKKLDEQLYVNSRQIRMRKDMNLDVSGIIKEKNYNKILKRIEDKNDKENDNNYKENINLDESNSKNSLNIIMEEKKSEENKIKEVNNNIKKINSNFRKLNLNKSERNSDFPLLMKRKTMKLLNVNVNLLNNERTSKGKISEISGFRLSKFTNRKSVLTQTDRINNLNNIFNKENQKVKINKALTRIIPTINNNQNINFFIFKAKSIDKNINKYPTENSNKYLIKEENKKYNDPLTVKQEHIPYYLRGKKYYMNYLYNILDTDLKVKDNFKIDHWENDILGEKKEKIIKVIPNRLEAFFVFNDKKLKLKKYKYMKYDDYQYDEKDILKLTHQLKYLPLNILALIPERLRDFGKYLSGKEINQGPLNSKPDSQFLSTITTNNQQLKYKSRSGKTSTYKIRSKGSLIMSSDYCANNQIKDEILSKKILFKVIKNKIDKFNYLTLSHYFLEEKKLFFKFIDPSKLKEHFDKIKENNKKKKNRMIVRNEVKNILIYDLKTNSSNYMKWSGEEVLYHTDIEQYKEKWNKIINSLENFNLIIWNQNKYIQHLQKIRYAFYVFANNEYFEYTVLSIVIINSLFLSFEGNFFRPEIFNKLNITNLIFNTIFIIEYIVKFIGLSPLVYFSDGFTYLDTIIIIFAIVDMATPSNNDIVVVGSKKSVISQLSFLRVFRIFRVVRLAKILRKMNTMKYIIVSIKNTLSKIHYIIYLLIMFILIFELLGIYLLNGDSHYQSFLEGFYTTYQILTLENWDGLLIQIWPLNHLCIFYFISWIFLGNYILFNLFISKLLQSFVENEIEEEDLTDDEVIEKIEVLPHYLYTIKNHIKDKNIRNIEEKKRFIDKEILKGKINYSKSFSTFKDEINYNYFEDDNILEEEDEEEKKNIFSQSKEEINTDEELSYSKSYICTDKRLRKWQRIHKLFKNNYCENSLLLFPQENIFRIFCMKLIKKSWFSKLILFLIILSTLRLIVDTFISGYSFVLFFDICDAVFNVIFLIEALLKICALGFAFDEGSYLRDYWNMLDALIVLCSFIEFHNVFQKYIMSNNSFSSVEFLKVLRLLRILRPLRLINHNNNLKLIVTSLLDSAFQIVTLLFILIVILFMFSIVGISLFYSYYHNCYNLNSDGIWSLAISSFNDNLSDYETDNDITLITKFCADKYNGIMDTGPSFKFSNLKTSFITSYILSTMEGWPDIMNSYRIYNDYYGIYFVIFTLVVSFFFINLFTGIMFKNFNESFKREQKFLEKDKKAPKYYDFLIQITGAQSDYIIWSKPMKGTIKYYLREIVDSNYFEKIIIVLIILNMIVMAITYEGCSEQLSNFLKSINYLFSIIFLIECVLKLFAYGVRPYFHISWNKFDFFVVELSLVDFIVNNIKGIDSNFLKSFQLIRVLKVLRVSRVLRLIKALKELEKLIQILQWSFYSLINVLYLTILIFSIFALLGCYLYDGDKYEKFKDKFVYINEYYNTDNFYYSYLLIFRCATGENWHNIMMEMAYKEDGRGEGYSIIFFIVGNFITSVILLNLLLMVILQQYDDFTDKKDNPIEKFNSFLTNFNNSWNKFSTDEDEGFRIRKSLVTQFFMELNWSKLNFPEKGKVENIKKYVTDLKLIYDTEDCVYYHDVIFKLIYKQMGSKIIRNNQENNLIFKTEKNIQKEISNMIKNYINKRNGYNKQNLKLSLFTFNPLTAHLYYKYSFLYMKTFINYYKENSEYLQPNMQSFLEDQSFNLYSQDSESNEEEDNDNSNSDSDNSSNNNSKSNSNDISKRNSNIKGNNIVENYNNDVGSDNKDDNKDSSNSSQISDKSK